MGIKKELDPSEFSEDRKKAEAEKANTEENQMAKTKKVVKKPAKKSSTLKKISELAYPTVVIRLNDKVLKELGLEASKNTRAEADRKIRDRAKILDL